MIRGHRARGSQQSNERAALLALWRPGRGHHRLQRRSRQRLPRLGGDARARRRALCITADSPSYPDRHRALARRIAAISRFEHEIVHTNEMARPDYRANPANRCYFCKHELYTHLSHDCAGTRHPDDRRRQQRRRPRRLPSRTSGGEGVRRRQPPRCCRPDQGRIRDLSRRAGLPTWDEPASACLSSRIPYFSEVTETSCE